MPSSLIFAALAVAWILVFVPMVAKRRQEVSRTTDAALASRVLRRPDTHRAAYEHGKEVPLVGEQLTERGLPPHARRYRPGRGGYDPEAAALAAQERYLFRQRVVLGLLIGVCTTLVLGLAVSSMFWWGHAVLVLLLVGYLVYRRRQVRIEEAVRNRRAARIAGSRGWTVPAAEMPYHEEREPPEHRPRYPQPPIPDPAITDPPDGQAPVDDPPVEPDAVAPPPPHRRAAPPQSPVHPTAVALDIDDEDPVFDELNPTFEPPYRRAVGE